MTRPPDPDRPVHSCRDGRDPTVGNKWVSRAGPTRPEYRRVPVDGEDLPCIERPGPPAVSDARRGTRRPGRGGRVFVCVV